MDFWEVFHKETFCKINCFGFICIIWQDSSLKLPMTRSTERYHLICVLTSVLIIEEEGWLWLSHSLVGAQTYLQKYKARRPANTAAKEIFETDTILWIIIKSPSPTLGTSLTTAVIAKEGVGSHFDWILLHVTLGWCWCKVGTEG